MSDFSGPLLRRALTICAIAMAVSALAAPGASAKAGDPDPSFGVNGRVVADVVASSNALATSMAIDPQGRIVVAGVLPRPMMSWPVVARFNPDGSLDKSFGDGGVVQPQWNGPGVIAGVAIDGASRIVLAGSRQELVPEPGAFTGYDITVARLLGSGAPDPSFSGDGVLVVDGGSEENDFGTDLALDTQGRIVLSGTIATGPEERRIAAVRATESGSLDPSFGGEGIASVEKGEGEAIAIDPLGRVVVAGAAGLAVNQRFAVVRLDSGGNPDPGFGENGRALLEFGVGGSAGEFAADVAVDALGRLVLVGRTGFGSRGPALAGRLLPDGSPDASFDGDGRLVLALPGSAEAAAVAIDPDGRILTAGTMSQGDAEEAFLARLDTAGRMDPSFGMEGIVRESFSASLARAAAVTVDSAGRYLIAGGATGEGVKGLALARYLSSDQTAAVLRCRGKRATIVGTRGRDRLRGTRRRDVIVALGGNDRIRAFAGRDLICAGAGHDLVRAGKGNDKVFGGPGRDRLFGQAGKDRLRGGPGRDVER